MNVLEIYPNFAWWFDAPSAPGIEPLREASRITAPGPQDEELRKLRPSQAYYLVGDAATFDLIPGVFDEIVLHYDPTPLKRLILDRRIDQWISAEGTIRYEPTVLQIRETDSKFDTSLPMKLAKLRRW